VAHPKDYRWSSYQHRALGMWDRLLDDDVWYAGLGMTTIERQEKYRQWIESQIEEREWEEIRQATQRGRLIGRETFQKQVEAMTGRRLVGEARGRPKKTARTRIEKVL
jgi:putative transposase